MISSSLLPPFFLSFVSIFCHFRFPFLFISHPLISSSFFLHILFPFSSPYCIFSFSWYLVCHPACQPVLSVFLPDFLCLPSFPPQFSLSTHAHTHTRGISTCGFQQETIVHLGTSSHVFLKLYWAPSKQVDVSPLSADGERKCPCGKRLEGKH